MKKIFYLLIAAFMTQTIVSCKHKELCYDHAHTVDVRVVFDWKNAPDASPASMALYLFPQAGGEALRYDFTDREGGTIRVPIGRYDAICQNSDNTDWAQIRHTDDFGLFETCTQSADILTGYGLLTRTLPRPASTSDERIAQAPAMLWSDRAEGLELRLEDTQRTVTFTPSESVCHYTVDIINVENLQYVQGVTLDGSLSGMAEGYRAGADTHTDTAVTFPFEGHISKDDNTISGSFLTFGHCATTQETHILTVYMILTDQSKWYSTFDVTDQIHAAEDPRNVHIVLDGLTLPKPIVNGGGFQPDVEEWESIHVDIEM